MYSYTFVTCIINITSYSIFVRFVDVPNLRDVLKLSDNFFSINRATILGGYFLAELFRKGMEGAWL